MLSAGPMLSPKKQYLCFLDGTRKNSRKNDFYTCTLVKYQQIKTKNNEKKRTLYILKMQSAGPMLSPRKQYLCFFEGTLKSSRKNDFYTCTLGKYQQIKTKNN